MVFRGCAGRWCIRVVIFFGAAIPLMLRELGEESRLVYFLFRGLPLGYCCQSKRWAPYPVVDPSLLAVCYLLVTSLAQGAFCVFVPVRVLILLIILVFGVCLF